MSTPLSPLSNDDSSSTKHDKVPKMFLSQATQESQQESEIPGVRFVDYKDESQLHFVSELVGRDLSEPYSIFTYRYFLHRFPKYRDSSLLIS